MTGPYELRSPAGDVPNVTFWLADDGMKIVAEPPGGRIEIELLDEESSAVRMWDTARGGYVSLDMVLRHQPDHYIQEWRNCMVYACEVAAGLYWSQRRSQMAVMANQPARGPGSL